MSRHHVSPGGLITSRLRTLERLPLPASYRVLDADQPVEDDRAVAALNVEEALASTIQRSATQQHHARERRRSVYALRVHGEVHPPKLDAWGVCTVIFCLVSPGPLQRCNRAILAHGGRLPATPIACWPWRA